MLILMIFEALFLCTVAADANFDVDNNYFDVFVFTQHWPFTTCIDWEKRSNKNSCSRIHDKEWSVHGLWPTQFGRIAPNFCNDTWKFDYDSVKAIRPELDQYWPDYELRDHPNSLWTHEWEKHGTCAAQLEILDSEEKYFQTGIDLAKKVKLTEWLKAKNIVPGGGKYSKSAVYNAVMEKTGVRPHIDCEFMSGVQFIKEIKVCLSKNLTFVHCDNVLAPAPTYLTNGEPLSKHHNTTGSCRNNEGFLYPSRMNPTYLSNLTTNHVTIGFIVFGCGTLVLMSLMVAMFVRQSGPTQAQRRRDGYESL
eukprot:TRINITY_DN14876_c0_g1_i1.p1 TRINITY_DN14876_c0_g1~~TRINITY_DN14876_c0_g1_i1.p1  ORF type:complete len:307 (+),score=55.20 TRINITY_DN14876_c0_g1_i1:72-992(+)